MNVLMIRSQVKPECVADVDAAIEKVFAAIDEAKVDGVHYSSSRLADGVTYIALLALDDGIDNPLPGVPEFVTFQENLKQWVDGPATLEQLTVVGSYRLF